MQNTSGDYGLGFGVFILQYGGCVQGSHLLDDYRQLHVCSIDDGFHDSLHLHLGTVLFQNWPDSTTSGKKERESKKGGGFHR